MPTDPDTADPSAPRVLLFGHPGSGKSSLLGALLQAGETQGETLGAEVIDPSRRLNLIRDHLYAGAEFHNTRTEVVTYTVRLRPWRVGARPVGEPLNVVLMDCDGTAANALLKHPDPLTERGTRGTVATAVLHADLIALVVNAGADDAELDAAFDEFLMFLERVHGRRTFEREVGGFPIFLVLAQCDQLAEPGDTREEWEARVRGNKRHALDRFSEFLKEQGSDDESASPYLPFGGVDVEGYAVAVRWPRLAGDPHPPDEPFGVAEFFHDAFAAAKGQADRERTSQRRLSGTLWAVLLTVAGLFGGSVAVSVLQPEPADPGLADRVRDFEDHDQPAAVRLAEKNIARNKRVLTGFQADPGFFALPADLREFVSGRLREIEDYEAYRAKLAAAAVPADARTLDELARSETVLTTDLVLPAEYTWGETEAARLRDKWLADVSAIRAAEAAWNDWFRGLENRGLALTQTRAFDGGWRERVTELDTSAGRLPFDLNEPIPGSVAVPQPRGEAVPQRVPFEFDRVYQARRDWDFARGRLLHLRDLADALGLTPDAGDPARRALVVPPPNTPGVNPLTFPGERLDALRRQFPRPSALYPPIEGGAAAYPEWELANFPDPSRLLLAGRVREAFENGARQVRQLLRDRLGTPTPGGDTPDDWQRVAVALDEPAFLDWGRFLRLLARLENPQAADPVAELAAFLRAPQFDLDYKGFELSIPLALRVPALVPAGPLTVTLTPRTGGTPVVRTFNASGEPTQQGLVTVYRFTAGKDGPLVYHPGDGLRAEVPVRSGDQRFTLAWDEGATRTFQFDRLTREPKLTRERTPSEPATGVTLTPAPGSNVPRLPVLLPEVGR